MVKIDPLEHYNICLYAGLLRFNLHSFIFVMPTCLGYSLPWSTEVYHKPLYSYSLLHIVCSRFVRFVFLDSNNGPDSVLTNITQLDRDNKCCKLASAINTIILELESCFQLIYVFLCQINFKQMNNKIKFLSCSQGLFLLISPKAHTELVRRAFKYAVSSAWNQLQKPIIRGS